MHQSPDSSRVRIMGLPKSKTWIKCGSFITTSGGLSVKFEVTVIK